MSVGERGWVSVGERECRREASGGVGASVRAPYGESREGMGVDCLEFEFSLYIRYHSGVD